MVRQAHGEMGTQVVFIFQGGELLGGQPFPPLFQLCQVLVPVGQGVFSQAPGCIQQLDPQAGHSFLFRQLRIQQLGPHSTGDGSHQPVGLGSHHPVGILLYRLVESLLPGHDLVPVDAFHGIGIGGDQAQEGRTLPVVVQVEFTAPVGNGFELVLGLIFVPEPGGPIAVPVEHHLGSTGLVGFFRKQGGEGAGFHRGVDHQDLVLLEADPFFHQHPGIQRQLPVQGFLYIHGKSLLYCVSMNLL